MNKFRANLHPAFFDPDKLDKMGNEPQTKEQLEIFTMKELEELKNEVLDDVSGKKRERISRRLEESHDSDKTNNAPDKTITNYDIWTKNITEGYGRLIMTLRKNHYFKDKNETEELKKIKQMYEDEVKRQYKKVVGKRSDTKFERVDQDLFDKDSPNSPANKIYTQLTGAESISTIERQYTEGYNTKILDSTNISELSQEELDSISNGDKIDFLSDDLPIYLWNVRKAPGALLNRIPLVHVKVDKPSKEDRKAIREFLNLSSKIQLKEGDVRDKAIALMEAFKDNRVNIDLNEKDYEEILTSQGITIDKKYLNDVLRAGNFFVRTQSAKNSPSNQHALYLSVLQILEKENGVNNTVKKFKNMVEKAKSDKKLEKKEGYSSGEKLLDTNPELYEIAKNLGITDFASATRLSEKNADYFNKTSIEEILANLNNDRTLEARDSLMGGSKSGAQFLEIFNQVGKEKALPNLVKHAKLINKALRIGLPDALFNEETIESNIKEGYTGLILLLQNIINKPGEDLYTLLSGHSENPFEGIDLAKENEAAKKYAAEMLGQMNLEELKKSGLRHPNPENIHSGLATALYTEYKRGIGLGGKISFDQWVKGLDMSTGFQVRNDGTLMVGLGLNYGKKIDLGKGWSTTPELSAGTFIPLFKGKPELSGSVGLNDEIAKEWITKNGVENHLGLKGGVTLMPSGVFVASGGINWDVDKAAGIETAEQKRMIEFRDKIIGSVLTNAFEQRKMIRSPYATKINFNDDTKPTRVETFEKAISDVAKSKDENGNVLVPEKDQQLVTNAVMRLLVNYNGFNIGNKDIRDVISQGIAEQYAMAWAEDRKAHISKKAYLSGATLGAFWVVGSPLVGIHAGFRVTKHDLDGYGDKWGDEYKLNGIENKGWDDKTIKLINQRLGLSDKNGLEYIKVDKEDGYIKVPKSITNRIRISEDMKGLIMRDKEGNVILSKWTTMREYIRQGSATKSKELCIGAGSKFETHLDTAGDEWFKDKMDDINAGLLDKANDALFSAGIVKNAIDKLKVTANDEDFKRYKFTEQEIDEVVGKLKKIEEKDKKAKITVEKQKNGSFKAEVSQTNVQGKGIELEYKINLEMFDSEAKKIADSVYERAARLDNPKALNKIKHPIGSELRAYKEFVAQLKGKNYETAKSELLKVIAELDKSYKGDKAFPKIKENDWPKGDALGQLLMSINNIFARSTRVVGRGSVEEKEKKLNQYEFTTQMGEIVKERAGKNEILKTLKDRLGDDSGIYIKLMEATENYRIKNQGDFEKTSAKAAHLVNAVGFNLGDRSNPENPLLNPEIYEYGMMDSDKLAESGFDKEKQKVLHKRAIKNFIENDALFGSIKKMLNVENGEVSIAKKKDGTEEEIENGKIKLDIGGKKVTLSSDMKFGYFTQCVNHTVILDNISVEDENGNFMSFGSGTWENGRYVEGNKYSIVASTTFGLDVSFTLGEENKEENKEEKPEHNRGSNPDGGEPEGDDRTIPGVEGSEIGSGGDGTPPEGDTTPEDGTPPEDDTTPEDDSGKIDHSDDGTL